MRCGRQPSIILSRLEDLMANALSQSLPFLKPLNAARTDLACLILRLSLAAIFIYHGLDKVTGQNNEWGANWMAKLIEAPASTSQRTPLMTTVQLGVAYGELVGGMALALGLFTRLAATIMIFIQGAAISLALSNQIFSPTKGGGGEYNFALIAMCVAVLFLGAGRVSFDWLFGRTTPPT
jgi:putative oxidoreductase